MDKKFILILLFILSFCSCKDKLPAEKKIENDYLLEMGILDFHINDSLLRDDHLIYGKIYFSTQFDSIYVAQYADHFNYRPIFIDSSYFNMNNKFIDHNYISYGKLIVCDFNPKGKEWILLTPNKKYFFNLNGMAHWPYYEPKPKTNLVLALPMKVKSTEIEKYIEIPSGVKRIFVY